MALVEIGDLKLADGPAPGTETSGFFFTDLGDWDAIPDSKSPITERPLSDGAFTNAEDFRQSLAYSIKGAFLGFSRTEVQQAKNLLKASVGRRPVVVAVTDSDGRFTRLSSIRSVIPDDDHGRFEFTFTIDAVAFDPVKYGDAQSLSAGVPMSGGGLVFPLGSDDEYWDFGADGSSGRVAVTNPGTANAYPVVSISGGLGEGFISTDVTTGDIVRLDRPIPVGSQVVTNMRTGTAYIDAPGNDVSGFLTQLGFFTIGPGETHVIQLSPLGAVTGEPQMTVTWSPAYL
jgi:hypothetical protein